MTGQGQSQSDKCTRCGQSGWLYHTLELNQGGALVKKCRPHSTTMDPRTAVLLKLFEDQEALAVRSAEILRIRAEHAAALQLKVDAIGRLTQDLDQARREKAVADAAAARWRRSYEELAGRQPASPSARPAALVSTPSVPVAAPAATAAPVPAVTAPVPTAPVGSPAAPPLPGVTARAPAPRAHAGGPPTIAVVPTRPTAPSAAIAPPIGGPPSPWAPPPTAARPPVAAPRVPVAAPAAPAAPAPAASAPVGPPIAPPLPGVTARAPAPPVVPTAPAAGPPTIVAVPPPPRPTTTARSTPSAPLVSSAPAAAVDGGAPAPVGPPIALPLAPPTLPLPPPPILAPPPLSLFGTSAPVPSVQSSAATSGRTIMIQPDSGGAPALPVDLDVPVQGPGTGLSVSGELPDRAVPGMDAADGNVAESARTTALDLDGRDSDLVADVADDDGDPVLLIPRRPGQGQQ